MKKGASYQNQHNNSDESLCVFELSPPRFAQRFSGEKRHSAPSKRHQELPFSTATPAGIQLGRSLRKNSYTTLLLTITDLFSNFKKRKSLNLDEILSTIQNVWKGPENLTFSDVHTEMFSKKLSIQESSSSNPHRRRLSVPETIMRKHILAQESLSSQECKYYHWSNGPQCSSDPNLNKKRDFNMIRKSTLLRRLWGDNPKPKLISGSFQEWQHSYKKGSSVQSLNSNHSSPEHMPKCMREITSPRRKQSFSPKRNSIKKMADKSAPDSPKRKMAIIDKSRESTTFTNCFDTNSDSACTNNVFNNTTNEIAVSFASKLCYDNENDYNMSETEGRLSTVPSVQETAVQTEDGANLNVISNVNLSQSTLDMIFKEVMKDVSKLTPDGDRMTIGSAIVKCDNKNEVMVKSVPNISLEMNSDSKRLSSSERSLNQEHIIIGKVRIGSPYARSTENVQPAIPRFSALPRTSSMEVNTSEEDKDESDTTSYVDSLEDFSSPRVLAESRKTSSDISQLLPEGKKQYSSYSPKKSSTFYIPIEVATDKEVKAVSELLPFKVREKLVERQQKREEKTRQFKNASAFKFTDYSVNEIKNNLNRKTFLPKKRTKPVLPSIESLQSKGKIDAPIKVSTTGKRTSRVAKTIRDQGDIENINLVYKIDKKGDFVLEPRKIYKRMTQENAEKRIEILEIMECIEIPPEKSQKSKIPLPVSNTANKKVSFNKPSYLDLDKPVPDQKLDQLIANILIDTLNHEVESSNNDSDNINANFPETLITGRDDKFAHRFDAIPEETPIRHLHLEEKNNNNDHIRDPNENRARSVKNKKFEKGNVSSIPKGWVTIHTVRKDTETPESTSDEGKQYLDAHPRAKSDAATVFKNHNSSNRYLSGSASSDSKQEFHNDQFISSSKNDDNTIVESTLLNRPPRKFGDYLRKTKMKREKHTQQTTKGDWSVTVSGTNSYGQMAPNVEMRLKFPINQNYSACNPQGKRTEEKKINFPKIDNDCSFQETRTTTEKQKSIDECLPKIQTAQNRNEKIDVSVAQSVIVPRQTKTSRCRYHLSRPREGYSLPEIPSLLSERQYYEIIRQIPGILAVTGRSISSEGKSFEER